MEIQKSTGIVLASSSTGEADYISRIYTKEFGKRSFLFKGLKKSKRRSHLVVEPGTVAELVYYYHEERSLHIIKEYQVYEHYPAIRNDYQKILLLHFFLETVDKTSGYNDKNGMIFDLLAAGIETMISSGSLRHLSAFFVIHLLRLHGILPGFRNCKSCRSENFREFTIDVADFQPVCTQCSRKQDRTIFTGQVREFLYRSLNTKFTLLDTSGFNGKEIVKLLYHLCIFIQGYFHIELKSKDLLISEFS